MLKPFHEHGTKEPRLLNFRAPNAHSADLNDPQASVTTTPNTAQFYIYDPNAPASSAQPVAPNAATGTNWAPILVTPGGTVAAAPSAPIVTAPPATQPTVVLSGPNSSTSGAPAATASVAPNASTGNAATATAHAPQTPTNRNAAAERVALGPLGTTPARIDPKTEARQITDQAAREIEMIQPGVLQRIGRYTLGAVTSRVGITTYSAADAAVNQAIQHATERHQQLAQDRLLQTTSNTLGIVAFVSRATEGTLAQNQVKLRVCQDLAAKYNQALAEAQQGKGLLSAAEIRARLASVGRIQAETQKNIDAAMDLDAQQSIEAKDTLLRETIAAAISISAEQLDGVMTEWVNAALKSDRPADVLPTVELSKVIDRTAEAMSHGNAKHRAAIQRSLTRTALQLVTGESAFTSLARVLRRGALPGAAAGITTAVLSGGLILPLALGAAVSYKAGRTINGFKNRRAFGVGTVGDLHRQTLANIYTARNLKAQEELESFLAIPTLEGRVTHLRDYPVGRTIPLRIGSEIIQGRVRGQVDEFVFVQGPNNVEYRLDVKAGSQTHNCSWLDANSGQWQHREMKMPPLTENILFTIA